jgi:hypothetical protein
MRFPPMMASFWQSSLVKALIDYISSSKVGRGHNLTNGVGDITRTLFEGCT